MSRVLVADDDPDIRMLLEAKIRLMGHLVVGVGSGEEALSMLRGKPAPDVAVLDVLMPGMSGLELLTRLRDDPLYAAMPAIFLSGRVETEDIDAGTALGATYLTKPVVISVLTRAITAALPSRAMPAGTW
jgi:CheY-like chemotaxis protein